MFKSLAMMDPSQRPLATAYYPSPPSQDEPTPNSRTYPAAMPYTSRDAMPPPTPISSAPTASLATPIQPAHSATPLINGSAERTAASAKQNRLSKACDGCSVRKVKCDEEGPPCRACRSLQIPCTFNRPSRRRGPPNRHAEAIKKQRLEFDATHSHDTRPNGASATWDSSPSTAFGSPVAFTNGFSQPKQLCAEAICPFELLTLLVDDFFIYMHPVHPFPHEPSFRQAFLHERQDTRDPRLLALLASMIGALVATYPRRPLKRLKDLNRKHLFRSSLDFVHRCRDIAVEARGPGLLGRKDIGVFDAATSYFLGHLATNTMSPSEGELYFGECFNILRAMGYQRYHPPGDNASKHETERGHAPPMPQHTNVIEREIAYRIYWALYIVVRSAFTYAFGSGIADIHFNPSTPLRRHPPFPVEVDDQDIFSDRIESSGHQGSHPLTAFNTTCKMHMEFEPIKAWKLSWAVDGTLDRDKQNSLYLRCLRNAEKIIDENLPVDFRIGPPPPASHSGSLVPGKVWEQGPSAGGVLSPSISSSPHFPHEPNATNAFDDVAARRRIAVEIQKANVHVNFLTARSFYLEKYWTSNGMAPNIIRMTPDQVAMERLSVARRLLDILSSVHPAHMEPNSFPFCAKIRQIASTLFAAAAEWKNGESREGARAQREGGNDPNEAAQAYVNEFLRILMVLEKNGRGSPTHEGDDEEELRSWADVRQVVDGHANGGANGVMGVRKIEA